MVEAELVDRLARALDESVERLVSGLDGIAVAFSGGLDSSITAFLSLKYSRPSLYVVGEEGSTDLENARTASGLLGLPLTEIHLNEDNVKESLPKVIALIGSKHPVTVSYKLPEYFVAMHAREKALLMGHGADELFGGYSRYKKMPPEELALSMQSDLEKLLGEDIPMGERVSDFFGKRFEYPFLSANVVEVALDAPVGMKVGEKGGKMILRDVARSMGLSEDISERRKKAAQYGSGIIQIMRRIAKQEGLSISRYVETLADF